jgi:adenylosuccinate synthase
MGIQGSVTVVLGGQAGSEGKGKIAGYLAIEDKFKVAVCNFMTNAGHTWVSDEGKKVMVQQLPQAVVDPNTMLFISAGSAIDPATLLREIEANNCHGRVFIHPRAMVIEDRHREMEAASLNRISSTLKGCGHALADKVARAEGVTLAKDHPELSIFVLNNFTRALHNFLKEGAELLVEAPQGFDLDINHGLEYPYCTSRQTTTAQAIADAGLPPQVVEEVIAVIRPYPIRVGDVFDEEGNRVGTSGTYLDSREITWEEVARRGGLPREIISEFTTVTGKLRRVFEPNWARLREMVEVNGVTQIALNFANYIDYSISGATEESQITDKVWEYIHEVESETGVPVTMVGTGARHSELIDLRNSDRMQERIGRGDYIGGF